MKFRELVSIRNKHRSPPSRGAWIEMQWTPEICKTEMVAPLAGGVD